MFGRPPVRPLLGSRPLIACVATTDSSRAKTFYGETLGLRIISEDRFALLFDAHGTKLRVSVVGTVQPTNYAVLGWIVPDIRRVLADLFARGVECVRFDGLSQDADGVWTSPAGVKTTWFRDPDGNILSLTQTQY